MKILKVILKIYHTVNKVPISFILGLGKLNLKFTWKNKFARIAKLSLFLELARFSSATPLPPHLIWSFSIFSSQHPVPSRKILLHTHTHTESKTGILSYTVIELCSSSSQHLAQFGVIYTLKDFFD